MLFYLNKTPFPPFPQRGRSSKTFPPWGKMKGGKKAINQVRIFYQNSEV
jgi:hypothetical protein